MVTEKSGSVGLVEGADRAMDWSDESVLAKPPVGGLPRGAERSADNRPGVSYLTRRVGCGAQLGLGVGQTPARCDDPAEVPGVAGGRGRRSS